MVFSSHTSLHLSLSPLLDLSENDPQHVLKCKVKNMLITDKLLDNTFQCFSYKYKSAAFLFSLHSQEA